MNKIFAIASGLLCATALFADNLIRNGNFDQPMTPECRIDNTAEKHAKVSLFTEDLTWNKCAKFELLSILNISGREQVGATVVFGGDKFGFPVKPDTVYTFSFEVKGNGASSITTRALEWTGTDFWKDRNPLKMSLGGFKAPAEWQKFSGTFKTSPNAKTAVIGLSFWWDTQYGPMKYSIGEFILIDNVTVEEQMAPLDAIKPQAEAQKKTSDARIAIAGEVKNEPVVDGILDEECWTKAVKCSGFTGLRVQDKASEPSVFMVLCGKDALYIGVRHSEPLVDKIKANISRNGDGIWADDVTEIFFGPVVNDRKLTQFAVSAGGGRFSGDGNAEKPDSYGKWESGTSRNADSWSVEMKIPYTLLGWSSVPVPGDSVLMNIARQRMPKPNLSTWSPLDGNFHDTANFGRLIIGPPSEFARKEADRLRREAADIRDEEKKQSILNEIGSLEKTEDPQAVIHKAVACAEKIRTVKIGSRKFIVSSLPPFHSPNLPMIPASITSPTDKITLRAAINDFKNLPLAVTNLTGKLEEYHVVMFQGGSYNLEKSRLVADDGTVFPAEKIRIMRGVRVKDRDSGKTVQCFDPLAPLDDSATVAAAPNDSALVWVQFDCRDVKPGKYKGVFRTIPLSEPSSMKLAPGEPGAVNGWIYKGEMHDIPVELEIMPFEIKRGPVKPWDVMRTAYDENSFKTMIDQDVRFFIMTCWNIWPKFNPDGSIQSFSTEKFDRDVQSHLAWAEKYGVKDEIRFGLGLGCYTNFMSNFGGKKFMEGSPEWERAWMNYVKCIADAYRKNNVPLDRVYVEVVDEPEMLMRGKKMTFDTLVAVHRLFKQAAPEMKTYSWLDCYTPASGYEQLIPYLDCWGLYATSSMGSYYKDLIGTLGKNGKKLWMYRCNTAVNSNLHGYYRLHAWIGYSCDVEVIGFFVYADATQGGWANFSWKQTPDGGVVYRSGDKIITSIRNECLKLGNQDIKYLDKLKGLASRKNGNAEAVVKARKFISEAVPRVLHDKAHDPNEPDKIREETIDHIMALMQIRD